MVRDVTLGAFIELKTSVALIFNGSTGGQVGE
jgi:hypothetical protein